MPCYNSADHESICELLDRWDIEIKLNHLIEKQRYLRPSRKYLGAHIMLQGYSINYIHNVTKKSKKDAKNTKRVSCIARDKFRHIS